MLTEIIENKQKEVLEKKRKFPLSELKKKLLYQAERPSFLRALKSAGPSVITEFKRKSPSKGFIYRDARVEDIVKGYENAGASAVSVLTDTFFDGANEDLEKAFHQINIPLLRKDFIIDPYQITEAKSIGASAILLIAAILTKETVRELSAYAHDLGLDVLFEIHSIEELDLLSNDIQIVGVNNRDLNTFRVSIDTSLKALNAIPEGYIQVSESGISSPDIIKKLYSRGYDAFLIGEYFMKQKDPSAAAHKLIQSLDFKKTVQ